MKIFVTGTSGFIGAKVLNALSEKYKKEQIVLLSNEEFDGIKTIHHDNYKFDRNIFVENYCEDIEVILHIGAFIPKDAVETDNIEKCNSNIINTQNVLNANLPNLKNIIFASTIDIYEESDVIDEKSDINPISLYGWSKIYCEKIIETFAKKHGINSQILRVGHVFGSGEEKYKKILPLTIKKVVNNENVQIWGDGNSIRTFIHVNDVAKAFVNAINLQNSNLINLVGEEPVTINELVKKIIDISGKNIEVEYVKTTVPNRNLIFDNKMLKQKLLKNLISLDEGLKQEYIYMENLK